MTSVETRLFLSAISSRINTASPDHGTIQTTAS
ncbi:unnamed protein product [Sordaria macrospora k-hell]|uniref:WGS project CABT00000000 data, contig 2.3 n=1 Tax=Sordaria macrospora (strain ATCC MYA-333 / DSM 997 / K(L3346) / K-hell) TaxID=771870 RepID=F7VPR5_SORMK|nr:uncharacterized protein SMAC_12753 [Sordaria macrospora k-hell]CCC07493.1 unnamed protein product [Sordaria macrospora k-hell]